MTDFLKRQRNDQKWYAHLQEFLVWLSNHIAQQLKHLSKMQELEFLIEESLAKKDSPIWTKGALPPQRDERPEEQTQKKDDRNPILVCLTNFCRALRSVFNAAKARIDKLPMSAEEKEHATQLVRNALQPQPLVNTVRLLSQAQAPTPGSTRKAKLPFDDAHPHPMQREISNAMDKLPECYANETHALGCLLPIAIMYEVGKGMLESKQQNISRFDSPKGEAMFVEFVVGMATMDELKDAIPAMKSLLDLYRDEPKSEMTLGFSPKFGPR